MTFPNESETYRLARDELLDEEIVLREQTRKVAEMRMNLPKGGEIPENYRFIRTNGAEVTIADLFGAHQALAIYNTMVTDDSEPCEMCMSFLAGMDASLPQLRQRMAMEFCAPASPSNLVAAAERMGLRHIALISSLGNRFARDYHANFESGGPAPMMTVFVRDGDRIRHHWSSEMMRAKAPGDPRHVDSMWPLWNALDLIPEGRGDWYPPLPS